MKNAGFILKLAGILFAIAFVCTFILVLCNNITEPVIAENTLKSEAAAQLEVLPEADGGFEEISNVQSPGIMNTYEGKDSRGNTVGYCFKVSTKDNESKAFGGEIQMIVGIDCDLNITGVKVTTMAETPGLGANATNPEWSGQFIGKNDEITVVKTGNASGNEINAISGATITSRAVTEGVNKALKAAGTLKGKEAK